MRQSDAFTTGQRIAPGTLSAIVRYGSAMPNVLDVFTGGESGYVTVSYGDERTRTQIDYHPNGELAYMLQLRRNGEDL